MTSPILGLTEMANAQSQPHVVVNAMLRALEIFGQIVAISFENTPPGSPSEGDTYVVDSAPTGDWVGHEEDIAYYSGGWKFLDPREGWIAFLLDENSQYLYAPGSPSGWEVYSTQADTTTEDIGIPYSQPGKPNAGAIHHIMIPFAIEIPAALSGTYGYSGTNATAAALYSLSKNGGAAFGTLTFNSGSSAPTLVAASATSFAAGDRLTITAPDPQDSTLANIGFTIKATKV